MSDGYIWAYTPAHDGSWQYYPPFVNLSRKDGKYVLIMRAMEDASGPFPEVGAWTELTIPDDEIARLAESLAAKQA